jgi:hypothetical protein
MAVLRESRPGSLTARQGVRFVSAPTTGRSIAWDLLDADVCPRHVRLEGNSGPQCSRDTDDGGLRSALQHRERARDHRRRLVVGGGKKRDAAEAHGAPEADQARIGHHARALPTAASKLEGPLKGLDFINTMQLIRGAGARL